MAGPNNGIRWNFLDVGSSPDVTRHFTAWGFDRLSGCASHRLQHSEAPGFMRIPQRNDPQPIPGLVRLTTLGYRFETGLDYSCGDRKPQEI